MASLAKSCSVPATFNPSAPSGLPCEVHHSTRCLQQRRKDRRCKNRRSWSLCRSTWSSSVIVIVIGIAIVFIIVIVVPVVAVVYVSVTT